MNLYINIVIIMMSILIWVLLRRERIKRDTEWFATLADMRKTLSDELGTKIADLETLLKTTTHDYRRCSKSLSQYQDKNNGLQNKLNSAKSLISRMKNAQSRRAEALYQSHEYEDDRRSYNPLILEFSVKGAMYQKIVFHSDMTKHELAIKAFEKITGLKIQEGKDNG